MDESLWRKREQQLLCENNRLLEVSREKDAENERLIAENEQLREAIRFHASGDNWHCEKCKALIGE